MIREPLHIRVSRADDLAGWVLECVEYPQARLSVPTLEGMGPAISETIGRVADDRSAADRPLLFEYAAGVPTVLHLRRGRDGTLHCDEFPALSLNGSGESPPNLVEAIARLTGVSPQTIDVIVEETE